MHQPSAESNVASDVTVIVPSYRGVDHLERCLESLAGQTLAHGRFEIVLVLNGPDDGSAELVTRFRAAHPAVRLRVLRTPTANAAVARNLGLDAVRTSHITFVDDDDWVSAEYLESLLDATGSNRVAVARMSDVGADGQPVEGSYVAQELDRAAGRDLRASDLATALSVNACKAFPTSFASDVRFHPELRSGEDVVFFAEMFASHPFWLRVCPSDADAVYFRSVRAGSVSRQRPSLDFAVTQRLDVIERLQALLDGATTEVSSVVRSRMRSQAMFINRYLKAEPGDRDRVVELLDERELPDLPTESVNAGLAEALVISYCFPPFVDTSAIVMAKRIRARGDVVDVISNDMAAVRGEDASLRSIADPFINRHELVETRPEFSQWRSYEAFRRRGQRHIAALEKARGAPYDRVYSRAMWPGSNLLAAQYKLQRPSTFWVAEFSDPLARSIHGEERPGVIKEGRFMERLRRRLVDLDLPVPETDNAMYWCEYMAHALADSLVFTNENQLEYMLAYQPEEIQSLVRSKATVSPHPVLPNRFYERVPADLDLPTDRVNIGYFGSFYKTRGLSDVLEGIELLGDERRGVALHVFTGQADQATAEVRERGLEDLVSVRPYIGFLRFLAATREFHCLLVNDAATAGSHRANPYLPSKWSDYRGSGRPVWGVVEPGSVLSRQPLDFRSTLGRPDEAAEVLRSLVRHRSGAAADEEPALQMRHAR